MVVVGGEWWTRGVMSVGGGWWGPIFRNIWVAPEAYRSGERTPSSPICANPHNPLPMTEIVEKLHNCSAYGFVALGGDAACSAPGSAADAEGLWWRV